jgi:hypothetical protein
VPLAKNTALGIAIMSYDGALDFGLLSDYDALPELGRLAGDLEAAIDQLATVAGVGAGQPKRNGRIPRSRERDAARTR